MKTRINERSIFAYYVFNIFTFGIYGIVFWTNVGKEVNVLCEGDGKKTMKYVYAWLLGWVTLGIVPIVWRCKLENRFYDNASRYDLHISEKGALVVVYDTIGRVVLLMGDLLAKFILMKNFNAIAKAYNDYNGLEDPDADKKVDLFADEAEA